MSANLELVPLTESELRARRSLKWSRAGPGQLPADVAEADFAVAEPIREALLGMVSRSDLGYPDFDSSTGGARRLAETFATRMRSRFLVPADPDRVEICAQIMQALCCVILTFSEPGDAILTHTPTYPPILRAIERLNREPVLVPVPRDGQETCPPPSQRVAVIVLCTPHNPTGRVFTTSQLNDLADLADRHGSIIFADEIHQDITYGKPHRSIAAVESGAERTILFTSVGKSFNIPGLRCAVGHFGCSALQTRFRALPWHLRSGAGILGIEATTVAWSTCEPWLDRFRSQLRRNRDRVNTFLRAANAGYIPPDGTYFAWFNHPVPLADHEGRRLLHSNQNLIMEDGSVFGQDPSFARLNFAMSDPQLSETLGSLSYCFQKSILPNLTRYLNQGQGTGNYENNRTPRWHELGIHRYLLSGTEPAGP